MASSTQPEQPLIEKAQMSAEFYSSLGASYEAAFGHDQGLLLFLQKLLLHLPPNANILDVGCGTGTPVATTLAAAGHHVFGIDISDEMVRLSQKAVPSGKFEVADMQTYTPPSETKLDAVLAVLSLFALEREGIETQVAKWGGWLVKGGVLCICSIAAEDIDVIKKSRGYDKDGLCARDIGFQFMGDEVKITLFTRKGWKELLEEHRFEIVDSLTELFVPPGEAISDEEMHYFLIARKVR
ncbi:hypothetical protein MMC17_001337 [Xylographa soralifera]|nr:hypothetical protein [Xylographa soralifera]